MKPEEQFFPQYEICKNEEGKPILLGRGGFSTVYEVRRRETAGRHYALKVIGSDQKIVRPELFRDTVRLQRLLGEQCPYIVRILDTAETTDAENGAGRCRESSWRSCPRCWIRIDSEKCR